MTEDSTASPRSSIRSGQYPRIFLDGSDAAEFLAQLKRLADAAEATHTELHVSVRPQLADVQMRDREIDRKLGILIDDRVRLADMERRLDRHEARTWIRFLAMVVLVFVTAVVTSFATSYLLLEGINHHGSVEHALESR